MASSVKPLWSKDKAFEWIKLHKMVAIVRTRHAMQARGTVEAILKGGFKLVEVAMTVLGATDVLREFSSRPGVLVGAGSVLSEKMAKTALASGAQFLMTPHTDPAILKLAQRAKVLCIVGALTPTEVVRAWSLGADVVRVFPVRAVGGAEYVRALKELFTDVPLMPSGGVTLENVRDYFMAGSLAVGAAGALMNDDAVEASRWADITTQARKFQEMLQRI
ncbi:MAG TPA: bifunctional 4-hydroxy-2-oxoglutarate aldolase/2-dehydro-3-deoxy-phosphogluconate aldolase [Elusimicrobiota bacterium]|nr:bifunctional 4-hydroxy-2-oxoglutarate aldolase/2-dehydro-3-deoxy-phosphogluconate aldolase [Elusimicrobiota bacterium]